MRSLRWLCLVLLALPLPAAACPVPEEPVETGGVFQAAHPESEIEADAEPPYPGSGWTQSQGGEPDLEFESSGVTLRSWLTLGDFDPAAVNANDCWGYTAPSGREYALLGMNTGIGVAEVTNPGDAQVIAHLPSAVSLWRDVKTYQTYAYSVSEGGGGIHVFDLSQIDSGVITDLGNVTTGGTADTHNVFVNPDSARLYRMGGGGGSLLGFRIYSLADPAVPASIGAWSGRYCHDAFAISWTEAPYAGKEVVFCFANLTSGGGDPSVYILDATDAAAVTVIGSVALNPAPPQVASYSHQGWTSPDRRYLYLGDEVDEAATGNNTLTRIFDIQDLANPVQAAYFYGTTTARDHNLYTDRSRLFEANYRAGLRILDASQPTNLYEIGYFDTYPPDDDAHYNGLWSVYSYFQSQTVIGSDIEKGLFVWTVDPLVLPSASPPGLALIALLVLGTGVGVLVALRSRFARS